jgi:hypothetical protein
MMTKEGSTAALSCLGDAARGAVFEMTFDLDATIGLEKIVDVRRQLPLDLMTITHRGTDTLLSWPLSWPLTSSWPLTLDR